MHAALVQGALAFLFVPAAIFVTTGLPVQIVAIQQKGLSLRSRHVVIKHHPSAAARGPGRARRSRAGPRQPRVAASRDACRHLDVTGSTYRYLVNGHGPRDNAEMAVIELVDNPRELAAKG